MNLLARIFPIFLFVTTSIHCERDKSDDFAIKQPTLSTSNRNVVNISEATRKLAGTMKLTDRIQFDGVSTEISLKYKTTCRMYSDGDPFETDLERPLVPSIPLYQFLPAKLFYDPNFKSLSKIACSIKFSARNRYNSQHNFELYLQVFQDPGEAVSTQLKLNTFVLAPNWIDPKDKLTGLEIEEFQKRNDFEKLAKYLQLPTIAESDLHLVTISFPEAEFADLRCSSFSETLPSNIVRDKSVIDLRAFSWGRGDKEGTQNRWKKELCRIIGYNRFGVTAVSPYFYVSSTPPKIAVSRATAALIPYLGQVKDQAPGKAFVYQSISIKNESTAQIKVYLPPTPTIETHVITRGMEMGPGHTRRIAMPNYNLALRVPNETLENGTTTTLVPNQTKTIEVLIPADYDCKTAFWGIGTAMILNFSKQGPPIYVLDGNKQPFLEIPVLVPDPARNFGHVLLTTANHTAPMYSNYLLVVPDNPNLCTQTPPTTTPR